MTVRVDIDQPLENADWPKGLAARKVMTAAYNPAQPREPRGTEIGGRWARRGWTGPQLKPDEQLVSDVEETWEGPSRWRTVDGEDVYGPDPMPQALKHGLTDAEYIAALQERSKEWLDTAWVATRVPAPLLGEILEDGRLKSQFETGDSRGTFSNDGRRHSEGNMFGYDWELPDEQRPIYGYMHKPGRADSWVDSYGEVELEMKHSIRSRTTFTDGDSYAQRMIPSPVDNPSYLSTDNEFGGDPLGEGLGTSWYVEAQMHGGVSVSDVAAIHVPYDWREDQSGVTGWYEPEKAKKIKAALARAVELGIPVEYDRGQLY